jgi:hypothetical protein
MASWLRQELSRNRSVTNPVRHLCFAITPWGPEPRTSGRDSFLSNFLNLRVPRFLCSHICRLKRYAYCGLEKRLRRVRLTRAMKHTSPYAVSSSSAPRQDEGSCIFARRPEACTKLATRIRFRKGRLAQPFADLTKMRVAHPFRVLCGRVGGETSSPRR